MNTEIKFQEFSIKEYIFIIRLHIKKIIFFMVIGFIIGVYDQFVTPPYLVATSTILIKEKPGAGMVMDFTGQSGKDRMLNAAQMIKSKAIARETVKTLWPRYKNNLDLFGSYPFYPKGRRLRLFLGSIFNLNNNNFLEKPIVYDQPYSEEIGNKFASAIASKISVKQVPSTNILKISYGSVWAVEAKLIVNTLTKVFKDFEKDINNEEAINVVKFLEKLVKEQSLQLSNAELEISSFQNKEQIYGEGGSPNSFSNQINDIKSNILENKTKINIGQKKSTYFQSQLTKQNDDITENIKNTLNIQVQALRLSISELEAKRLVSSVQYGENHEAVNEIKKRISNLKNQLDQKVSELISKGIDINDPLLKRETLISKIIEIESEQKMIEFEIEEAEGMISFFRSKLDSLPTVNLEYMKLKRKKDIILKNYSNFRTKLEDARIALLSQVGTVQILDLAPIPVINKNDNYRGILMGLLLGLASGFGLAFGLEFLDNSVKTIYDIEKHNLTVLGVIPAMENEKIKPNNIFKNLVKSKPLSDNTGGRQLITLDNPKSPISEAYRSLRTSLLYSDTQDKIKSILVSSAGPGDGKTTTVANLAITMANMGKKVLLIDTDLRRPVINKVFNLPKSPGITEHLTGHFKDFSKLILESKIKNLYIVPSGITPPNPSELLGSKKLVNLIKKLESEWDIVFFDSPPLIAVTDATMVSKEIDKIIVVVKVGKTENKAFEHTISALKNVSAPIGGIVLNAVTDRHNYGGYYYYYQYYKYYGSDAS
ncbi:MAG: polysaccharide biosynthesis tyrosine autokinase [Candidatus Neomarinimicrobiota bacterium]